MTLVKKIDEIDTVWQAKLTKLAKFVFKNLKNRKFEKILEIGGGAGQFTIPLLMVSKSNVVVYDSFSGNYKGTEKILKSKAKSLKLDKRLKIIKGNATSVKKIKNQSFDLIISHEFICDLDKPSLLKAFKEFYRLLKPNGIMIHCYISPIPENISEDIMTKADSIGTDSPSKGELHAWWSADEILPIIKESGFRKSFVKYFDLDVKFNLTTAIERLRRWKAREDFINKNKPSLSKYGLEIPKEECIFSLKES